MFCQMDTPMRQRELQCSATIPTPTTRWQYKEWMQTQKELYVALFEMRKK